MQQAREEFHALNKRALVLLRELTTKEHFQRLTQPDRLPQMLEYLTDNMDRLERYAVVKSAIKESLKINQTEGKKQLKESPGQVKRKTLNAFLGNSADSGSTSRQIDTKVVMSRIAPRHRILPY